MITKVKITELFCSKTLQFSKIRKLKNTNEEKSLDEIQEELNEITLRVIESTGISREDYFAWLAEHGIDW